MKVFVVLFINTSNETYIHSIHDTDAAANSCMNHLVDMHDETMEKIGYKEMSIDQLSNLVEGSKVRMEIII